LINKKKIYGSKILGIALNLIAKFIGKKRIPLNMGICCIVHLLSPKKIRNNYFLTNELIK
jgi:hypothetical protein